jgi:drug/metabolite transporter (DMT)-like permease
MIHHAADATKPGLGTLAPGLFVLLWSTGFIGAKLGLPYAGPLTFLALRFALAAAFMSLLAVAQSAPWPRTGRAIGQAAAVGLMVQVCYLGGVFVAISRGLPAGVAALIVCLQPLLTGAVAGRLLGERVTLRQWLGLGLGIVGTALVLEQKLGAGGDVWSVVAATVGLLGITFGTIYQKRFGATMDLRTGSAVQYVVSAVVLLVVAASAEPLQVVWAPAFLIAIGWLTVALSFGAVTLFFRLIRRGDASRVASMMYLVPPVTAVMAWLLFGETLGPLALLGMVIAALGVALVNR